MSGWEPAESADAWGADFSSSNVAYGKRVAFNDNFNQSDSFGGAQANEYGDSVEATGAIGYADAFMSGSRDVTAGPSGPPPPIALRHRPYEFGGFGTHTVEVDAPTALEMMMNIAGEQFPEICKFKEFLIAFAKAKVESGLEVDVPMLAKQLIEKNGKIFLIAVRRPSDEKKQFTVVHLNGEFPMEFVLTIQHSETAPNERMREMWPESREQNLERLATSGFTCETNAKLCNSCGAFGHDRRNCTTQGEKPDFTPQCVNCNESGHFARHCTQERVEPGKKNMTCRHCDQEGHIAKECPDKVDEPRTCRKCGEEGHMARECPNSEPHGGGACRNCGEEGHFARECPQPRTMPSGCRNCGEEGHMSRECPQPKDLTRMQCRNCDEMGHVSRECPKPRDYSRVKCQNCDQMGHTRVRCPQPPRPAEDYSAGGAGGYGGFNMTNGATATNDGMDTSNTEFGGGVTSGDQW